jgi:hydrogenase maturation protease
MGRSPHFTTSDLLAKRFGLGKSPKTLVLGVGNQLLSDEGFGVQVVTKLINEFQFPDDVRVLDGGTLGLELLVYLEGIENLILVDAVEADQPPGTLIRLEGDEVPTFLTQKISPHQYGIPDLLQAARLRDIQPKNIVLWGVQPATVRLGLNLSELVEPQTDLAIQMIREQLQSWGHLISRML